MREIKFRGTRIDNGNWVYGHYFVSPLTDENSGTNMDKGWFFLSDCITRHCIESDGVVFVVDPESVGQYIGQKDEAGDEIYDGDILQTNEADWIAQVIYHYDGFMLTGLDHTGFSCSPDYNECKILSNRYDHPELIKNDN